MSFRHNLAALAVAALASTGALADVTVSGVTLPERLEHHGATLELNGAGLRTKLVQLYVAALYLEEPTKSAREAVESRQHKRVELHVLRDLTKQQVAETIRGGFVQAAGAALPALEARLDRLIAAIPALDKGEVFTVSYVPGRGTTIEGTRVKTLTIEGEDFARALFAIWLGDDPVQQSLKRELLAGGADKTASR